MSALVLENIGYKYPKSSRFAIQGINERFETGKVYALVGKSGAGKTTLLSLIAGLDKPTEGTIILNDKDLRDVDRDDYRAQDIGVIFQAYNLLTNSTALENIILSMNISKSDIVNKKDYALKLLEKLGIDKETANRKILKLSGGEQQRIAITRALSHDPEFILADEPTGNLDPETEGEILEILVKLAHEENRCVIIVTHSATVKSVADQAIEL